jgi:hypothetical protein
MSGEYSVDTPATLPLAKTERPARYLLALSAFVALGFVGIWQTNVRLAPEMYSPEGVAEIAETLSKGENYAVFDLNINIRLLRDEQIARMTTTPDVIVLGASHWQEAHTSLIPHKNYFNAHVHRDYYEDILGVTEMLVRHDRLPKQMIIAIRDDLFTPLEARTDHLWLPGIPYYNAMAKQLGMQPLSVWESMPIKRWRELASLPMLHSNAVRLGNASGTQIPRPSLTTDHASLDTLLPGGSIVWSRDHQAIFTAERAHRISVESANYRLNKPPKIDLKGVAAIDTLLAFLKSKNVEVFLAKPPFNPDYYDRVVRGTYGDGLRKIEKITQDYATKYGWQVIGSFNPHDLGCKSRMYIDSEHASPECLAMLFDRYIALDMAKSSNQIAAVASGKVNDLSHDLSAVEPIQPPPPLAPIVIAAAPPSVISAPVAASPPAESAVPMAKRRAANPKLVPVSTVAKLERKTVVAHVAPKAIHPATVARHISKPNGNDARTDHYSITSRTAQLTNTPVVHQPHAMVWPGDQYYPDRVRAARVHRIGHIQSR